MAIQTTYQKKLLDPRWQKKRLEILERDDFMCQVCGDTKKTLIVHHKNYYPNNDPWDYVDTNFITLCNKCHETEHDYKNDFNGYIHDFLLMGHDYKSLCAILETNMHLFS
jgi:5-methylcytosine-specific restriction endonuclease McrA